MSQTTDDVTKLLSVPRRGQSQVLIWGGSGVAWDVGRGGNSHAVRCTELATHIKGITRLARSLWVGRRDRVPNNLTIRLPRRRRIEPYEIIVVFFRSKKSKILAIPYGSN